MKIKLCFYSLLLLLSVEMSSCATVRVRTAAAEPAALTCTDCQGSLHRWFWGYVYNGEYMINNCDSKSLQAIQVTTNFWQGVVTVVTLGVYCPVTVKWSCAKEK